MESEEHPHHSSDCRNCGAALTGPFCAECGQAEKEGHAPSLGHFAHDLVHEFTHVDGSIVRTIRALLFEPGRLTREYWDGRIVSWIRPIRIFLVVAAIHLLVSNGVGPMNMRLQFKRDAKGELNLHVGNEPPSAAPAAPVADPVIEAAKAEVAMRKFESVYRSIRYASVVGFALAVWLFYRKRQPYFASCLILSLHFFSAWYLMAILAIYAGKIWPWFAELWILSVIYLPLMLRRLFLDEGWPLRIVKSLLLFAYLIAFEGLLVVIAAWAAYPRHT